MNTNTTMLAIAIPIILTIIPIKTANPSLYSNPTYIIKMPALGIALPNKIGRVMATAHTNAIMLTIFSVATVVKYFLRGLSSMLNLFSIGSALSIKALNVETFISFFDTQLGSQGEECFESFCDSHFGISFESKAHSICTIKMHKGIPKRVVNPGGVGMGKAVGNDITAMRKINPSSFRFFIISPKDTVSPLQDLSISLSVCTKCSSLVLVLLCI